MPDVGAQPAPQAVGWSNPLSIRSLEGGNRHGAIDRNRFSKRLDTLNFVQGLGKEIGFAAAWA